MMQQFPPAQFSVKLGSLGTKAIGCAQLDLASVLSGIQHDEDGRFGLWCEVLLGKVHLNSLGSGCPAIDVDQFFARGDGHYLNPENVDARAVCYRAIALSIRDVLFASLIGKDPRQAAHYWTPFGGQQPARWASLRLVPKPLPPDPAWKPVAYQKRKSSGGGYWNHQPLSNPTDGLDARWQRLSDYITASDDAIPQRTAEENELRQTKFKYHHLPYIGTDLGDPKTAPGVSGDYYDLKSWLEKKTSFLEHIGQDEWWAVEMCRLAVTYASYKSLDADAQDNAAHAE